MIRNTLLVLMWDVLSTSEHEKAPERTFLSPDTVSEIGILLELHTICDDEGSIATIV